MSNFKGLQYLITQNIQQAVSCSLSGKWRIMHCGPGEQTEVVGWWKNKNVDNKHNVENW